MTRTSAPGAVAWSTIIKILVAGVAAALFVSLVFQFSSGMWLEDACGPALDQARATGSFTELPNPYLNTWFGLPFQCLTVEDGRVATVQPPDSGWWQFLLLVVAPTLVGMVVTGVGFRKASAASYATLLTHNPPPPRPSASAL